MPGPMWQPVPCLPLIFLTSKSLMGRSDESQNRQCVWGPRNSKLTFQPTVGLWQFVTSGSLLMSGVAAVARSHALPQVGQSPHCPALKEVTSLLCSLCSLMDSRTHIVF